MVDSLSQAAANSCWLTVDPDTYRYFFSASAQVFAAIFAVVAIAYSFRISDIQKKREELRKEKLLAFNLANVFELPARLNVLLKAEYSEYDGEINESLEYGTWEYDEDIIDRILDTCHANLSTLIMAIQNSFDQIDAKKKQEYQKEVRNLSPILAVSIKHHLLIAQLKRSSRAIVISSVLSSLMTAISLILLGLQLFRFDLLIAVLSLNIITMITITYIFVSAFIKRDLKKVGVLRHSRMDAGKSKS